MEQLLKTCLRELESKLGGQRFDDDEDQVAAEGDGKAAAPGAAPEECICVDMEFTEKYEIVHKVEIQSERYGTMNMHCVTALADHFKGCIEKKTWYSIQMAPPRTHAILIQVQGPERCYHSRGRRARQAMARVHGCTMGLNWCRDQAVSTFA